MARKVKIVKIEKEGRDFAKVFRITEMPSLQAEKWAMRALQGLIQSGVDVPENFAAMPMAQMASVGIKALGGIPLDILDPLMDQVMACVEYIPNPSKPDFALPLGVDDNDIEEVATRIQLKKETLFLHIGFFTTEADPTSE